MTGSTWWGIRRCSRAIRCCRRVWCRCVCRILRSRTVKSCIRSRCSTGTRFRRRRRRSPPRRPMRRAGSTMASPDITRMLPPAPWADPRAQLLEDTWLLTIFAVLLATAFPWFVSAFNIDFAAVSKALLALGGVYVCMSMVTGLRHFTTRAHRRLIAVLNAAGITAMAFVWLYAGGLQNPVFLLAFVLPVIGSGSLSRWQPYLTATLAVVLVAGVSLSQDPELSWYAAGRTLVRLLGAASPSAGASGAFLGFYAPVAYDLVLLEVFAILILACAVAAESINNSFGKLLEHLNGARADAASGQEMWSALMQRLPLPALLVDAESLEIVQTSEDLGAFGNAT